MAPQHPYQQGVSGDSIPGDDRARRDHNTNWYRRGGQEDEHRKQGCRNGRDDPKAARPQRLVEHEAHWIGVWLHIEDVFMRPNGTAFCCGA